jgi:hypothetical protein
LTGSFGRLQDLGCNVIESLYLLLILFLSHNN